MEQNSGAKKSNTVMPWFIFAIVALVILGVIAAVTSLITKNSSNNTATEGATKTVTTNTTKKDPNTGEEIKYDAANIIAADENNGNIGDHVRGKVDSKVVVVEYADFQCPGCASLMPRVHNIYEQYKDEVAFVFRNYPIAGHQNARIGSAAAEAAGRQGKFWEMTEALYANRADWIPESGNKLTEALVNIFKSVAPEGDSNKFRTTMLTDENIAKKVEFDYQIGREYSKVTATPAIYVNGVWVDVSKVETTSEYAALIDSAIKTALESAK